MPATEPDAKTLKKRLELCLEALRLRKKISATTTRIEAIKAELKIFAKDLGRGFRETDTKLGHVSVSPEKPERFDGDFPVVDVRKWQGLTADQRQCVPAPTSSCSSSGTCAPRFNTISLPRATRRVSEARHTRCL